jgi:hypothetical protein
MAITGDYGNNFINRFACLVNGNKQVKPEQTGETTKATAAKQPVDVAPQDAIKLTDGDWKTLCGINISSKPATTDGIELADSTNEILASLGYNYKVSESQVARVTKGLNETVLPGLNTAADKATAARAGKSLEEFDKALGLA